MVTPKRVIILAVIVIAALCLLDADHITGQGLCASVVLMTTALLLAILPALTERLCAVIVPAYRFSTLDLPTLPPKA